MMVTDNDMTLYHAMERNTAPSSRSAHIAGCGAIWGNDFVAPVCGVDFCIGTGCTKEKES
jgi:hypothetical protein